MLKIEGLTAGYGAVKILQDLDLDVPSGQRVAILGANGAGKTTLLRAISGQLRHCSGRIEVNGEDICRLRPDEIVRRGVVHVPEGRGLFPGMTVLDNLLVGAHTRWDREINRRLDDVLIAFPALKDKLKTRSSALSGGQQQMLAIARALMARPRVLLLDEPTIGLAPVVVEELVKFILTFGDEQTLTCVLVEQNVHAALACTSYAHVLHAGAIVLSGPPEAISEREVLQRYLGEATAADEISGLHG